MLRRSFLKNAAMTVTTMYASGCALIFSGGKNPDERDYEHILWGYIILDLLMGVGVGGIVFILIDFGTGAIYARKGSARTTRAHPVQLCEAATQSLKMSPSSTHAGVYLKHHLHSCAACSEALLAMTQQPEVDLSPFMNGPVDGDDTVIPVELVVGA